MAGIREFVGQYGADAVFNAKASENHRTCLHFAAQTSDGDVTWFLLSNGANPSVEDKEGRTPLYFAAKYEKLANIEILLHFNADVSFGKSQALFYAADNAEIARLLLQNGAKPDDNTHDKGRRTTPFYEALHTFKINNLREMAKWMEVDPVDPEIEQHLQDISFIFEKSETLTAAIEEGRAQKLKGERGEWGGTTERHRKCFICFAFSTERNNFYSNPLSLFSPS